MTFQYIDAHSSTQVDADVRQPSLLLHFLMKDMISLTITFRPIAPSSAATMKHCDRMGRHVISRTNIDSLKDLKDDYGILVSRCLLFSSVHKYFTFLPNSPFRSDPQVKPPTDSIGHDSMVTSLPLSPPFPSQCRPMWHMAPQLSRRRRRMQQCLLLQSVYQRSRWNIDVQQPCSHQHTC